MRPRKKFQAAKQTACYVDRMNPANTAVASSETFFTALRAPGPEPGRQAQMTLYDRVLGDWWLDAVDHEDDGSTHREQGEVHFAWVLEGRAIQDVWIVPKRERRTALTSRERNRYGTTLRIYDPASGEWRVSWFNPVSGAANQLTARRRGDDIVQEGALADGTRIRWAFTEITARAFHWLGESSRDGGTTWRLETEFFARRIE